jgi:hypothetical protein
MLVRKNHEITIEPQAGAFHPPGGLCLFHGLRCINAKRAATPADLAMASRL